MRQQLTDPPACTADQQDGAPLARFETFFFGGVATVLLTRAYLAATGYPQVGSGNLHVAHVLWGGLLMGAALVALVIVPGGAVKVRAALVGGIGFGQFIDEVGKFLTKDVDYFFRPAIAVMYVVFVGFYLVVRGILQRRRLTDQMRLAAGLEALADQQRGQLRQSQRDVALSLLAEIEDPGLSAVATQVRTALADDVLGETGVEHRLTVWRDGLSRWLGRLFAGRHARRLVLGIFVVQAALSLIDIVALLLTHRADAGDAAGPVATISGATVTLMVIVGVVLLLRNRYLPALHVLRGAIAINLLVSQVFLFASQQFGALIGFTLAVVMLMVLRTAIRQQELAQPSRSHVR